MGLSNGFLYCFDNSASLTLCKAKEVLPVPVWLSAYFWSLIYPDGKVVAKFIKDFTSIEPFCRTEVLGSTFSGYAKFKTLILA